MKKKIFTLLFAVVASYGMINAEVVNGTCGNNLTWSYNTESKYLAIEGSGMMSDYHWGAYGWWNAIEESTPWSEYAAQIATVTLPEGLTHIGSGAFQDCSAIKTISLPNSVKNIGEGAFCRCKALISITGTNVQFIQTAAFADCEKLTTVNLGTNVQEIGAIAFRYCISITSITFPNSLVLIGEQAFSECTGLTSVTIPNSVTRINENAFAYCSNLNTLTIGSGVNSIGRRAFAGCSSLQSVTSLATTPPVMSLEYYSHPCDDCEGHFFIEESIDEDSPVFEDVVCYNIPLYVPEGSIKAYQHTDQWKEFDPIQVIQNSEGIEEAMSAKTKNAKVIYEGQVLIERGKHTYTLTGQEVK